MTTFEISPSIVSQISSICKKYDLPKIFDILSYNIRGGKLVRYDILTHIVGNSNMEVTEESKFLVGFVMEIFHASFIISDDIVDNSEVRRGIPCFYFTRKMKALRDSRFLISLIYKLLKSVNVQITRILEKCVFDTCLGQTIDTKSKRREEYTFNLYKTICELKTSSYSVYMPISCGYVLGGRECPDYLEKLTNLVGLIYQMNDDHLNFIPDKTNKTSNDLEEYKLTYFTAKLNEELGNVEENIKNGHENDLETFFKKEGVPDFVKTWITSYFDTYMEEKGKLVKQSREMIQEKDEKDLLFLYDILKKYELN